MKLFCNHSSRIDFIITDAPQGKLKKQITFINNFSRYSCLYVLHGFCKITSRKLFKKSFLECSHMETLGAKTSQWRPLQVVARARALLAIS
jgi:hypothetical protein